MLFYFEDVAVKTEEIKESVCVHLFHVEAVNPQNSAFLRTIGGIDDPP